MPSCKLILTDIDGTILPYGQKAISDRALAAIHAAQAAGIRFGPCSGRAASWIPPLFQDDDAACSSYVAGNGLEVALDGKVLRHTIFDPAVLEGLVSVVSRIPRAGVLVFSGRDPYLVSGAREDLAIAFNKYASIAQEVDEVPYDKVLDKANVFVVRDLEGTRRVADELNAQVPGLDVDVPQPGFLNVMPSGINKASGIDVLVDALGITLEQVVAFGDGGNDVAMLSHVGNGVAVASAQKEALDAASWVIGPCEEDSVADAIERLARGEELASFARKIPEA